MITQILPELVITKETNKFFFVIDQEVAIYNAIKQFFQTLTFSGAGIMSMTTAKVNLRVIQIKIKFLGK